MMKEEILTALEHGGSVVFEYGDKSIELNRHTTLNELQESFGFEMDILDICRANWKER